MRFSTPLVLSFACAALVGMVDPAASARQRRDPVEELQSHVERITGLRPADCGRHLLKQANGGGPGIAADEDALRQSVKCGVTAAAGRKAFWTFKQDQGIDSWIAQGLLGTSEGIVYRFFFDSAPCGGPGCAGVFNHERCDKPVAATGSNGLSEFRCSR